MSKYDEKAAKLSNSVWISEVHNEITYDDDLVKRCIAHARMDIVLLVSHLSSVNSQLSVIKWLLAAILAAIIFSISN
jgi:hypothetical protein